MCIVYVKHQRKRIVVCWVSQKMYLTLTLYFKAVITMMLEILGCPVSPDLCNSFDTSLICFHDPMNKWYKLLSKFDFAKN